MNIWLECLSSLHKSQMRKAASIEGMRLVHIEILQYLSISNKYSNTAQAMSEYLGQTKGSISQSISFLEELNYIERKPCKKDGRAVKIYLTKEGKACLKRMFSNITQPPPNDDTSIEAVKEILFNWQAENDMKSFGQCKSCRFNESSNEGKFKCGLTGERLSKSDIEKICREHEFPLSTK